MVWNLCHLFLFFNEMKSVTSNNPLNATLLVACYETHKLSSILNHKHLLHIVKRNTLIAAFCWPGNFISDGIYEFLNKKIVGRLWNVLLLSENLLVRTLYEVSFEWNWDLKSLTLLFVLLLCKCLTQGLLGKSAQFRYDTVKFCTNT